MLYPTTPQFLRLRRLIVAGVAIALLLIACLAYAVLSRRSDSTTAPRSDVVAGAAAPNSGPGQRPAQLDPLSPTSDPETFARSPRRSSPGTPRAR